MPTKAGSTKQEKKEGVIVLALFDDLVEGVFSLDPNVRYVAVLDNFGQHLSGGMREGKTSINPMEEEDKLFSQTIISRGMSETWRKYFGAPRYLVVAHEKLLVFQFPCAENVLLLQLSRTPRSTW
jgi:hypothetical protein